MCRRARTWHSRHVFAAAISVRLCWQGRESRSAWASLSAFYKPAAWVSVASRLGFERGERASEGGSAKHILISAHGWGAPTAGGRAQRWRT